MITSAHQPSVEASKQCRTERAIRRQLQTFEYSRITWRTEAIDLIVASAEAFKHSTLHRWEQALVNEAKSVVQIDAYIEDWLPDGPGRSELILGRPNPASLVYSMHPNGSIDVSVYLHASSHLREAGEKFVLDVLDHACCLAGSEGRKKLNKHFAKFDRLCLVVAAGALPTAQTARIVAKLRKRSERFQAFFEGEGEARRYRHTQDVTFGAGLVAGLIASTIFPLARDFGTEARARVAASMNCCEGKIVTTPASIDRCLRGEIDLDRVVSNFLTTGNLLMLALAVSLVLLFMIWKNLNRR